MTPDSEIIDGVEVRYGPIVSHYGDKTMEVFVALPEGVRSQKVVINITGGESLVPIKARSKHLLREWAVDQIAAARARRTVPPALTFPPHKAGMRISHNDHLSCYQRVEEHLDLIEEEPSEWLSPEDRQRAIATGDLWEVQWYPDTPVAFRRAFGSTLENALAAAAGGTPARPKPSTIEDMVKSLTSDQTVWFVVALCGECQSEIEEAHARGASGEAAADSFEIVENCLIRAHATVMGITL